MQHVSSFFLSTVEQMLKNTCTCPSIRWQRPAVISQDVSKRRFRTLWSTVELRIITETIYDDHKTQVSLYSVRLIKEVNDPELIWISYVQTFWTLIVLWKSRLGCPCLYYAVPSYWEWLKSIRNTYKNVSFRNTMPIQYLCR